MKPSGKRNSLIFIAIIIAGIALFSFVQSTPQKTKEIPLSEVITMSQNSQIAEIAVEDEALLITTVSGEELKSFKFQNSVNNMNIVFKIQFVKLNTALRQPVLITNKNVKVYSI